MSLIFNGTTIETAKFNGTTLDKIIFNGTEVYSGLPTWDSRGLNYNSWDTIQKYIKAGKFAEKVSIGNTKTFTLNNKTYTAEVVSINDGTGSAAQWYPNKTVDFICKELFETPYQYNSTNTNSGGFPSSALKNTLVNTIYPLFPSDLKAVIIDKSHSYNSSTSGALTTLATKLWLPTQYEISGATATYAPGETASNNKKYTLSSLVKKRNGQSSADLWWLGSLSSATSYRFWIVNSSGGLNTNGYATDTFGVPLGFRIG